MEFLLVVRHGHRQRWEKVEQLAERLADTIGDLSANRAWQIRLATLEHAGTQETDRTAVTLALALANRGIDLSGLKCGRADDCRRLAPDRIGAYSDREARARIDEVRGSVNEEFAKLTDDRNAILIVGHQPAIDWFLDGWVDEAVAVDRAELVCLVRERKPRSARDGGWHLWWVISGGDDAIEALRDKVSSKMNVLGVLAGFATAILGSILLNLPTATPPRAFALMAAACFGLAAVLFVGALLAYDRLMMPPRFWRSEPPSTRDGAVARAPLRAWPVWRPPSSAAWVLYQHSVRLWTSVVLALAIAGAGAWLLVPAALWPMQEPSERAFVALSALLPALLAWCWWESLKPKLGTDD